MLTIRETEDAFQELQMRLLRGDLDVEGFKIEVERLNLVDSLGHQWRIGWYTGRWYRHEQGRWIQESPLDQSLEPRRTPSARGTARKSQGRTWRRLALWLFPAR